MTIPCSLHDENLNTCLRNFIQTEVALDADGKNELTVISFTIFVNHAFCKIRLLVVFSSYVAKSYYKVVRYVTGNRSLQNTLKSAEGSKDLKLLLVEG